MELDFIKLSLFELAVSDGKCDKVKEFIKNGEKVYKQYKREQKFDLSENLILKACRHNCIDVFQVILEEYEKDYIIAKSALKDEQEKIYLLDYIFIAYCDSDEDLITEMQEYKKIISNNQLSSFLVIVKDFKNSENSRCEIINLDKNNFKFIIELLKRNGIVNINVMDELPGDTPAGYVVRQNRLDLLKRMHAIGLNMMYQIHGRNGLKSKSLFEEAITNHTGCNTLKYLLTHCRQNDDDDLLMLTAQNQNSCLFENIMEFLVRKKFETESLTPTKLIEQIKFIFDSHPKFVHEIIKHKNIKLLNYILKYEFTYNIEYDDHQTAMHDAITANYYEFVKEILRRGFDVTKNFEKHKSILNSITADTNKKILDEIVKFIPKHFFFSIKSSKFIELIIFGYRHDIKSLIKHADSIDIHKQFDNGGNTALHLSIILSCDNLFKKLTAHHASLLAKNIHGDTTLILSCRYGSKDMIRYIIKHEPKLINILNVIGYSPLREIMHRGNDFHDIFDELIEHGADLSLIDINKVSCLDIAIMSNSLYYVKKLFELGVNPQFQGEHANTALHLSAKLDSVEIFDFILQTGKVDLESQNYRGNTILHNVSKAYNPEHFRVLFKNEIIPDVNKKNYQGKTPLHVCFDNERFQILLDNGADINILDDSNNSPYITCASEHRVDILMNIFHKDIDLTITSTDGMTLLYYLAAMRIPLGNFIEKNERIKDLFRKCSNAVEYFTKETPVFQAAVKNLEYLEYMFRFSEEPIDLSLKDDLGKTALFRTVEHKYYTDTLKFLLEKGADVNATDNKNETVLFKSKTAEITEILLQHKASTAILNENNESALHEAAKNNNLLQILILIDYGADIYQKNNGKKTPIDLITDNFTLNFVKKLLLNN